MDPRAYVALAALALAATGVAALTEAWWWALTLTALHLTGWLVLNFKYAESLGSQVRSEERAHGDVLVARAALITSIGGLLLVLCFALGDVHPITGDALATGLAALATIPTVMGVSTLTDWYFIRSRRDGEVCAPPCKRSDEQSDKEDAYNREQKDTAAWLDIKSRRKWQFITRMWYLHRSLTILIVF